MKPLSADFNPSPETPPKAVVESFFRAAEKGNAEHIRDCLEMYPVLAEWRNETRATAFIVAARNGNISAMEALFEAGADLQASDAGGMNALCAAAYHGYSLICDRLIDLGADPGARGRNGMTAISAAHAGEFPSLSDHLKKKAEEVQEKYRASWRDTREIEEGVGQPVQVLKPFTLKPPKP